MSETPRTVNDNSLEVSDWSAKKVLTMALRVSNKMAYPITLTEQQAEEILAELAAATERAEKAETEVKRLNYWVVEYYKECRKRAESAERLRDEMLVALNLGKRIPGESPVQTIMRLNDAERRAEENARAVKVLREYVSYDNTFPQVLSGTIEQGIPPRLNAIAEKARATLEQIDAARSEEGKK